VQYEYNRYLGENLISVTDKGRKVVEKLKESEKTVMDENNGIQ
jgi:hypothetical protein